MLRCLMTDRKATLYILYMTRHENVKLMLNENKKGISKASLQFLFFSTVH